MAAGHHVLLSHGLALEVIRRDAVDAKVGITIDLLPMHPFSDAEADIEAAQREDVFRNRWSSTPCFEAHIRLEGLERFGALCRRPP